MRAIDAALETLAQIAENDGAIPEMWLDVVKDHELSPEWSLLRQDLAVITNVLAKIAPCKFLEIGAGLSTPALYSCNPNGLNVSLEDSEEWADKVKGAVSGGSGVVLTYSNSLVEKRTKQRTDWKAQIKKMIGYETDKLLMPYHTLQKRVLVPDWLWTVEFDVILVDGPFGFGPGRSGTTLLASKLAGPTSVIFVDDVTNRPHELEKVANFFPDRYAHSFVGGKLTILV